MCMLGGPGLAPVDAGVFGQNRPFRVKPDQDRGNDPGDAAERDQSAVVALDVDDWVHGFHGGLGPHCVITEKQGCEHTLVRVQASRRVGHASRVAQGGQGPPKVTVTEPRGSAHRGRSGSKDSVSINRSSLVRMNLRRFAGSFRWLNCRAAPGSMFPRTSPREPPSSRAPRSSASSARCWPSKTTKGRRPPLLGLEVLTKSRLVLITPRPPRTKPPRRDPRSTRQRRINRRRTPPQRDLTGGTSLLSGPGRESGRQGPMQEAWLIDALSPPGASRKATGKRLRLQHDRLTSQRRLFGQATSGPATSQPKTQLHRSGRHRREPCPCLPNGSPRPRVSGQGSACGDAGSSVG